LFEVLGIYDKDGSAMLAWFGRAACLPEQINHSLYLSLTLNADEQRHVASPEKAAGAGYTGHAIALGDEPVNHARIIDITHNGNDHLHVHSLSQMLKALDIEHKDRCAAYLSFDHHCLSFEDGRLGMGWDKLSPGVTAFTDML
jgi:hypothetical protein